MSRVAIYGIAVVLLVSSYLLLQQYKALERNYRALTELPVGTKVRMIEGFSLDGTPLSLNFTDSKTAKFVFVLSPRCPICLSTWSDWAKLITLSRLTPGTEVWVIDLSGQLDAAYLRPYHLESSRILTQISPKSILEHRFNLVPQTLLVSPSGELLGIWTGELGSVRLRQVEDVFRNVHAEL